MMSNWPQNMRIFEMPGMPGTQEFYGLQSNNAASYSLENHQPRPTWFKDVAALRNVPLAPNQPITIERHWPAKRKILAKTYNRLGGLMSVLAQVAKISAATVLAVWQVESGGRIHVPGSAIIRFENHLFFKYWGRYNVGVYNSFFKHGGYNNQPGSKWQHHQFREDIKLPFRNFHGSQPLEYRVLNLATRLANPTKAVLSISIGGPQILVANYRAIGYNTALEMYNAFQQSERAHVTGFFDFCRYHRILKHLQTRNWKAFTSVYNGKGQVATYSTWLEQAYQQAILLPLPSGL